MSLHISVLYREVINALQPVNGGVYVDATYGGGGHTRAILERVPGAKIIALDRDPSVFGDVPQEVRFIQTPFSDMEAYIFEKVDGIIMDLGVSSMQIDQPERGFSFMREGPLDMRMDPSSPVSASTLVNRGSFSFLAQLFQRYGEERYARPIARTIVERRKTKVFETSAELAQCIASLTPKKTKIHPATKCFQALRIFVNDELVELARGLTAAENLLKEGGILAVISFHSLEDRIVKNFFKERSQAKAVSRYTPHPKGSQAFSFKSTKLIVPTAEEIAENRRSRSAKMRVGERTSRPAFPMSTGDIPPLPPFVEGDL